MLQYMGRYKIAVSAAIPHMNLKFSSTVGVCALIDLRSNQMSTNQFIE